MITKILPNHRETNYNSKLAELNNCSPYNNHFNNKNKYNINKY